MQKIRHFAVRGSSHNCIYCNSLGLEGAADKLAPEFVTWLERAGYSHVVFGCGTRAQDLTQNFSALAGSSLIPIFIRHRLEDMDSLANSWLVSDEIPDTITHTFVWIPCKSHRALAEQVRALPREAHERFFIHWPHPALLGKWGWTWNEVLAQQEHLCQAFPYFKWTPPPGWDIHNPEIDRDLKLETPPELLREARPSDFQPEVSIVIPTYNNRAALTSVVEQALKSAGSFEVIVADDGSNDGTQEWIQNRFAQNWPRELVYLSLQRPRPRKMGGGGFRAGIARNIASVHARGRILLFLDSDILIPTSYVDELIAKHQEFDLIQATRLQYKDPAPEDRTQDYESFAPVDFERSNEMWETFQRRQRPWDDMLFKWKYVSTFCLSIKRQKFFELGAFRRSFNKYGFEDTDLGYRAARAGLRFHRSNTPVYHFKHAENRSEFKHSVKLKQELLKNSSRIFFLNNPDPTIVYALPNYLRENKGWARLWS